MNNETLRYFRYIAKYKNITQAAKHLFISQSTLSRNIMALENELGVKLFLRNNKMVELTEAGEVLYKNSQSLIDHMDTLTRDVVSVGKGEVGILKVTTPACLVELLQQGIDALQEGYPDIRCFVEAYNFSEIPLAIKYHFYDVGITYDFSLIEDEDLSTVVIGSDEFVIAYPKSFAADSYEETLRNLVANSTFIVPEHIDPPFINQIIAQIEDQLGVKMRQTMEVRDTNSLILNTSLGIGYGLLPRTQFTLIGEATNIEYLSVPGLNTHSDVVAIYRRDHNSELIPKFLKTFE